jgi:STE24 endopeptidase
VVAEAAALLLRPRDRPAPVDVAPRDYFSDTELGAARRYRSGQRRLLAAGLAVELTALGLAARRAPRPLLDAGGAATGAALSAGLLTATLPVAAVSRVRGRAVGLVTQGWGGWAADTVKRAAIEAALAGAGGGLLTAATRRFGSRWWLPGSAAMVGFGVLGSTVAPVLLDPLFNRFTPLPNGRLRGEVLGLAERAGVRVGQVYEVDASRRTTAANAYVSGLGPTKRVVLFDTLVRDFTPGEVRFVIAHELAHQRNRDVPRSLAFLALVTPVGMYAVARLGEALVPAGEPRPAALVPAVALAGAVLAPALAAIGNQLSRAVETRADRFALELTGDRGSVVEFHRRIAVKNVAEPQPPRWARIAFGTHPTTMERIGQALAAEHG